MVKKILVLSSLLLLGVIFAGCSTNEVENKKNDKNEVQDLVINKNEVGSNVKYFPFKVDGSKMEVMAVKTDDGKIRTAFNTCQICIGSPKAYYEQEDDVLICQNCGNRFTMDMIEELKGGCNPIPIMSDDKYETDETIVVKKEYLKDNKNLFTANWKTK